MVNFFKKSHFIIALFLLAFGNNLYAQESTQKALFDAIRTNNTFLIESLVKADPALIDSPFIETGFLSTVEKYPIHEALRFSDRETIALLVGLRADFSRMYSTRGIMSISYKSPLEILIEYRDLQLTLYFLEKLKITPESYTKALLWAAENQQRDKVKYLLSIGEKVLLK